MNVRKLINKMETKTTTCFLFVMIESFNWRHQIIDCITVHINVHLSSIKIIKITTEYDENTIFTRIIFRSLIWLSKTISIDLIDCCFNGTKSCFNVIWMTIHLKIGKIKMWNEILTWKWTECQINYSDCDFMCLTSNQPIGVNNEKIIKDHIISLFTRTLFIFWRSLWES